MKKFRLLAGKIPFGSKVRSGGIVGVSALKYLLFSREHPPIGEVKVLTRKYGGGYCLNCGSVDAIIEEYQNKTAGSLTRKIFCYQCGGITFDMTAV